MPLIDYFPLDDTVPGSDVSPSLLAGRYLDNAALDLLNLQPPVLRRQPVFQASAAAQSEQLAKLNAAIDQLQNLVIPKSAGDYLYLWEAMTGVTTNPVAPLEERLDVVLAFLARMTSDGSGADWVRIATALIGTGWSYRTRLASPTSIRNILGDPRAVRNNLGTPEQYGVVGNGLSVSISYNPDADLDGGGVAGSAFGPSSTSLPYGFRSTGTVSLGEPAMVGGQWYAVRARVKIGVQMTGFAAGSYIRLNLAIRGTGGGAPIVEVPAMDVPNIMSYPAGSVIDLYGKAQAPAVLDVPTYGATPRPGVSVMIMQQQSGNSVGGTLRAGRFMVTPIGAGDTIPEYGAGYSQGWVWDGTADASPSRITPDNPALHHVRIYLNLAQAGLNVQLAKKLFEAITPANTVVDILNGDALILDSSVDGLMDDGQLG